MKEFRITVNGQSYSVIVEELSDGNTALNTQSTILPPQIPKAPAPSHLKAEEDTFINTPLQTEKTVAAPMPGVVQKIVVTAGQTIQKGEVLLILEAMKMENEIIAPQAGIVKAIYVSEGATVNTGDALLVFA